jgi:alkylhydroperoxidase family enzyme
VSWFTERLAEPASLDAALALRPQLRSDYHRFRSLLWQALDPVVLELCRLRVAQLIGCRSELLARTPAALSAGLDEDKVSRLSRWPSDPTFSPGERACLAFAEQFVLDPHGVTDAQAAAVLAHLGAPGMVALTQALGIFEGFTRLRMILGVTGDQDGARSAARLREEV